MTWFHRHEFDPEKWELVEKIKVYREDWGVRSAFPMRLDYLYKNTCKTCGDLVFRKESN